MRLVKLLFPIVAVCALVAFGVVRLFAVASDGAPPAPRPPEASATRATGSPPPSLRVTDPTTPVADAAAVTASPASSVAVAAPEGASPAARTRAELEQRLRASGATAEPWAAELGESMRQVLAAPEVQAAIRNAPTVECFAEGCVARLVFASASEFDQRQQELGEARALERWPHVVTGPERQPDGSVENALVVFRPPSPEELAAIEERRALLSGSR